MFTDIAGYTAMMQQNEALALAIVRRHREVLEAFTPQYQGEILEYYGDGSLSIFPSATDAVRCALALQKAYREPPPVPLRIGIHVGELIRENGKVFGDGINLASRIQSLGQAGTVFFSQRVREDIRNQTALMVVPMGPFEFKNVEEPMEVFALAGEGLVVPDPTTLEGKLKTPRRTPMIAASPKMKRWVITGLSLLAVFSASWLLNDLLFQNGSSLISRKLASPPAIAILPFRNESPDQEQTQYFCNGVMETILNKLARIEGLLVIPRQSMEQFRESRLPAPRIAEVLDAEYLLEGSLFRHGSDLRLHVNLLDARRNATIWSGEFPGKLEDVFRMENEVALNIVEEIEVIITPLEKDRLEKAPTENYQAYDYFLQGMQYLYDYFNFRRERDAQFATSLAMKALEEDPGFGESFSLLSAITYLKDQNLDSVLTLTQAALDRDPNLSAVYTMKGRVYRDRRQWGKARENFEQALRMNPNDYDALLASSLLYLWNSEYEEALARLRKAKRLNRMLPAKESKPLPATVLPAEVALGWFYRDIGAHQQAEEAFRTTLDLQPDNMEALEGMAFQQILKGEYARALEVISEMQIAEPNYPAARALKADLFILTGNYGEAADLCERLLAENHGPNLLGLPGLLINIKNTYAYALGAMVTREQAYEMFREQLLEWQDLNRQSDQTNNRQGYLYYWLAQCHSQLGNKETAFQYLRQITSINGWHNGLHDYLLIDPLFGNLREEAEFQTIAQEIQSQKKRIRERILEWEEGRKG